MARMTMGRCFGRCATTAPGISLKAITPDGVYKLVRAYSAALGFEIGAHALRATAATNGARPPGRHRQGAGVARARQHRHDANLRPSSHSAGGQPDVQGGLLRPLAAGRSGNRAVGQHTHLACWREKSLCVIRLTLLPAQWRSTPPGTNWLPSSAKVGYNANDGSTS